MTGDAITADTFYRELKHRFSELLENEGILKERVDINTRSLTPEQVSLNVSVLRIIETILLLIRVFF